MRSVLRTMCAAATAAIVVSATVAVSTISPASAAPSTQRAVVARAQDWGTAEEQEFVDKINQLRASLGLATLAVDPELTAQARIWSQTMKDAGNIFHTQHLDAGISADWEKLGENVGVGGTVDDLFNAFVASPKHYENLVDPSYRFIGVGVVWDGSRMFTAHRFMALQPPAPATVAPKAPAKPRTTVAPATPVAAAPAPTPTPTTTPTELDATEPTPPVTPPPPPAPVIPPATPERVSLILSTIDDLLS